MSSHAQQLAIAQPRTIDVHPSTLFQASGWLVVVATAGSVVIPALMWALLPASFTLAYALLRTTASAETRTQAVTASALAFALSAAAALTIAGAGVVAGSGYEPAWLIRSSTIAAIAIVSGLAAHGVILMRSGARSIGFLVGAGLLIGMGIDRLTAQLLPPGLFIGGVGFYVGMLLVATGLIRLGRRLARG